MAAHLIYEVECELDPDVLADYDAWLPGHVRQVLAHAGFLAADVESPRAEAGTPARRRVRYRLESAAFLDDYLANHAAPLRAAVVERFGTRVRCERRVLDATEKLASLGREPRRCLECGAPVAGNYCRNCGQAGDMHVLSMREVAGDVAHSLLHLDSRVWRTLRLLVCRPGELTREFIAGRHQRYLPPFRLYLVISILFFAVSALLPDTAAFTTDDYDEAVQAPVSAGERPAPCTIDISDSPALEDFEKSVNRACAQMRADGGKRFTESFAATAPKLMFIFLPLIAAVALLFYWRPRRLYAEHLVLFLHNHAFTFALLGVSTTVSAISELPIPAIGLLDLINVALTFYLVWYVYRSMRVVYGQGRFLTTLKLLALAAIYFVLLGATMLGGFVYTLYRLA